MKPFIVGDHVPESWIVQNIEQAVGKGSLRTLLADFIRLGAGFINARRAYADLGQQVDWVYERLSSLQSIGWIFKKHGTPWIVETSAPFFYEAKKERKSLILHKLAHRMEIKAYQDCSILVCVSDTLKNILVREAGVSPEKIIVIPNGADTAFFTPENYAPKKLFDNFTIGYVGSLITWQGLDLLISAIHELKADGINLSLVVVGDGSLRKEWEAQAHKLNLEDNVKFVGQISRDEVPSYIAGFDVGYAGHKTLKIGGMYHSPLKIYEYMAMAKPVIASDFADARQALSEGETGFLFQGGDKESLKRALIKVYENRINLPKMGLKAREEIINNHSWEARVSDLISSIQADGNK